MNNQKSTILLTGGAGYIGSHTSLLLAQLGYKVIILDNLVHQQVCNFAWATFIKGDCGDTELVSELIKNHKIDAVMHFAAYMDVGQSVREPLSYYDNNVTKTLRLVETMLAHSIKTFIFSSSCAVYGTPLILPLTENHPKNPISPYGKTKLMIEMALEDLHAAYGLNYVALRYFNAAGALPEFNLGEQHHPETHIIPLLLQAARLGRQFSIFGTEHATPDGTCIRDFLHVLDIAQAHLMALQHLERQQPSDSFNLGTGQGISVKDMVAAVEKVTRLPIKTVHTKARAGDPAILVADPSKAHAILGWKPQYSNLEYIIKTAWAYETAPKAHHSFEPLLTI